MSSSQKNSIGIFTKKIEKLVQSEQPVIMPKAKRNIVVKDLREDCHDPISKPRPMKELYNRSPTFANSNSPVSKQPVHDLEKSIEEFNASQELLLREYYNKGHILISGAKGSER